MQESFLRLGILINTILLKNLSVNHWFAFPEIQEVSKKDINKPMCNATLPYLVCHLESYTPCIGIQKASEKSLNHAISYKNLPWNIDRNKYL